MCLRSRVQASSGSETGFFVVAQGFFMRSSGQSRAMAGSLLDRTRISGPCMSRCNSGGPRYFRVLSSLMQLPRFN